MSTIEIRLDALTRAARRLVADYTREANGDSLLAVNRALHEAALARGGDLVQQDPVRPEWVSKSTYRNPRRVISRDNEAAVPIDILRGWAEKPYLNVHKIIATALDVIPARRDELVAALDRANVSRNSYGAVGSLMTNKGNAYGRVFIQSDGLIDLHPDVKDHVHSYTWTN